MKLIPTIRLIRVEENYDHGTFGVLLINSQLFSWTLEPKDEENKSNISSIPAQQYECKRYSSPKYPDTFEITNVPDRFNVLFHSGNTDDDTAGCILLGNTIGKLKGNRAILNSGNTFNEFRSTMKDMLDLCKSDSFHLTIVEKF